MALLSILDVLRNTPKFGSQAFTSRDLFSSSFMGAATSFAVATHPSFGIGPMQIAHCDAGATLGKDDDAGVQSGQFGSAYLGATRAKSTWFENFFENHELRYKQYTIKLKPFLSLLHWKNLCMTSLKCFAASYFPTLELIANTEVNIDWGQPFYRLVRLICRELSVAFTQRILERVAVNYASQCVAWKLLKDIRVSVVRKAGCGLPRSTFCFRVCKTTLRGRMISTVAALVVEIGIGIYDLICCMIYDDETDVMRKVKNFGFGVYRATVTCIGSLVFASIRGGIGSTLIHSSTGHLIGCWFGGYAGPYIIRFCFGYLNWPI